MNNEHGIDIHPRAFYEIFQAEMFFISYAQLLMYEMRFFFLICPLFIQCSHTFDLQFHTQMFIFIKLLFPFI